MRLKNIQTTKRRQIVKDNQQQKACSQSAQRLHNVLRVRTFFVLFCFCMMKRFKVSTNLNITKYVKCRNLCWLLVAQDAWNHDVCTLVPYGPYKVAAQNVTFKFQGKLVRQVKNLFKKTLKFPLPTRIVSVGASNISDDKLACKKIQKQT